MRSRLSPSYRRREEAKERGVGKEGKEAMKVRRKGQGRKGSEGKAERARNPVHRGRERGD